MSRLNGFCTASAIDKHYKYCNGLVKSSEQKNWLKFHNGKAHFKLPFIVYTNFEIILKLVDKQYREKMTKKTDRKRKTPYTEYIKARNI